MAALDCGTNSLRLLVTDLDPATGAQRDLDRRLRIVRLGEGVDRTGALAPAAVARALAAVQEYAGACAAHRIERVRVGATSAVRDAAGAGPFVAGVRDLMGVEPEVLSGDEEGRLSATGALLGLPTPPPQPALVVDIGGGSTELVAARRTGRTVEVLHGRSLDVGSVRLTERHLRADPSTAAQRASAIADVDAALDLADVDWTAVASVVGVAGTVTSVAAHALGMPAYDPARIHGAVLARSDVLASCQWFAQASVEERLRLPWLPPGRADVIGGGALVLDRVLRRLPERVGDLVVSECDILDGLAWSLVE